MDEKLTVRFRVGDVYKGKALCLYYNDKLILKKKRPVMAPGEMEQLDLKKEDLLNTPDLSKVTIRIEEA